MRNVSDETCRETQSTHFTFNFFFFFENRAVYETMWKNTVDQERPQMTIRRTCISLWVHKATDSHSWYVLLIAFPLQKWLHERVSILRYTCIACLVTNVLSSLTDPLF